jgi:hypothetical protein
VQTGGGKLDTCINHVGMVCPLCWLEGLGLATLVFGGVTVVCCCGRGHPEMKQVGPQVWAAVEGVLILRVGKSGWRLASMVIVGIAKREN